MFKGLNGLGGAAIGALMAAGFGFSAPALADGAGWFLGGMVTSRVLGNMERNTQANEAQAYRQQQPQPVQQAAPPPRPTPEQQLQQLDRLAAGGYITPEEYKAKKQAILQRM